MNDKDRLTKKNGDFDILRKYAEDEPWFKPIREVVERLSEYEDTGLSPQAVTELKEKVREVGFANDPKDADAAWKLSREILIAKRDELLFKFGTTNLIHIFVKNTYAEARRKMKGEARKATAERTFEIGDVVQFNNGSNCYVITSIYYSNGEQTSFDGIDGTGETIKGGDLSCFEKTGRHVSTLDEICRTIKEAKEEIIREGTEGMKTKEFKVGDVCNVKVIDNDIEFEFLVTSICDSSIYPYPFRGVMGNGEFVTVNDRDYVVEPTGKHIDGFEEMLRQMKWITGEPYGES